MTTEEILKTIGEVPQTKTVWSLMASTASAIGINANKTSIAAEAMRKAIEAANIRPRENTDEKIYFAGWENPELAISSKPMSFWDMLTEEMKKIHYVPYVPSMSVLDASALHYVRAPTPNEADEEDADAISWEDAILNGIPAGENLK